MVRKHLFPSESLDFPQTLHEDKHKLETVEVPIVTISATFKKDLETSTGEHSKVHDEVVLSRAHFSMAVALLEEAKRQKLSAHLIDPINYVSPGDWKGIARVEYIGQLTARIKFLRTLKNLFDKLIRSRLPVAKAIEEPLLYAVSRSKRTIISVHYESGNILAKDGKQVLELVTDPHVRPHYLFEADRKNISFAVFDENTKQEFLKKAQEMGKEVQEDRVIVTGPPVDPRIVDARQKKKKDSFKKRGLRLVVTTSGLGTNKDEIRKLLDNLFKAHATANIELLLYASTHEDFKDMFYSLANEYSVRVGGVDSDARVRVMFHPSIISANQDLIEHGFPWADGFVTKPSGDMAYDAVAAGCFLLTLEPWGEWEENIEKVFSKLSISQKADVENFSDQITNLTNSGWIQEAIGNSLEIDKVYLEGSKNIVKLQQRLA